MRKGIKDVTSVLTSKAAVLLVSLAIQSSLAWFLGPGLRGEYAVCLLFAAILGTVFGLGIDIAGRYFAGSGRLTRSEVLWSTWISLLVCSGVAVVVGRVLIDTNLGFLERAPRASFMTALAVIPFYVLSQASVHLLVGLGRISWMAITTVVNVVVQLIAVVVFVKVLGMGANGALLAILVAGAASILFASVDFARMGALSRARLRLSHFRDLLSYGLRSYVARLSFLLNARVGTMVLAFFVSADQIGLFAAGSGLVIQILLIPTSVEAALFSRVAGHAEGRPEVVGQAARVTAAVAGTALLVLAVLAKPIISVLLSPRFLGTVPLIWVMIPGIFVRAGSKVLMSYFWGTDRPAVCSWAMGLGMVVHVAALVVLVPLVGLSGAAWAMTASFFSSSLVLVLAFRRVSGMSFRETWRPRRADLAAIREVVTALREKLTRSPM